MILNLAQVKKVLLTLEEKYGISTLEFMDFYELKDEINLADIEEGDIRDWSFFYNMLIQLEQKKEGTA